MGNRHGRRGIVDTAGSIKYDRWEYGKRCSTCTCIDSFGSMNELAKLVDLYKERENDFGDTQGITIQEY